MPSIEIRDAQEQDVPLLAKLSRFVHDIHVDAYPAYFKRFDEFAIGAQFTSTLRNPNSRACIASIGDVPVGYAVVALRERPEDARCLARRWHEIEEIGVSPAHRRRGVARALIEYVDREARSHGIDGVGLTSWSFNRNAHAAFRALGFRPLVVRFRYGGDEHE